MISSGYSGIFCLFILLCLLNADGMAGPVCPDNDIPLLRQILDEEETGVPARGIVGGRPFQVKSASFKATNEDHSSFSLSLFGREYEEDICNVSPRAARNMPNVWIKGIPQNPSDLPGAFGGEFFYRKPGGFSLPHYLYLVKVVFDNDYTSSPWIEGSVRIFPNCGRDPESNRLGYVVGKFRAKNCHLLQK